MSIEQKQYWSSGRDYLRSQALAAVDERIDIYTDRLKLCEDRALESSIEMVLDALMVVWADIYELD